MPKLLKVSKEKLDEIDEYNSREENYKAYRLASMALINMKNTYDLGDKYAAFSCPMVASMPLRIIGRLI